LFCVSKKSTPQEKACLAVLWVYIAIIIAWDLCITRLEALIFISLHALNWADYTINIYLEIKDRISPAIEPTVDWAIIGGGKYRHSPRQDWDRFLDSAGDL